MKFDARSTTREVTGCKCDAVVATCRPVQVYQIFQSEFATPNVHKCAYHTSHKIKRPPSVPSTKISPFLPPATARLRIRSGKGTIAS